MLTSGPDDPTGTSPQSPADFDFDRLERYLAGDLSPSEHAAFMRWLDTDPRHRRVVEAIAAAYGRGSVTEPHWDVDAMRARALFTMGARPGGASDTAARPAARRQWRAPRSRDAAVWTAGAVMAACVVVATLVVTRAGLHRSAAGSGAVQEYVAQAGEQLTVTLRDGTHLTLAPASRVQIPQDYALGDRAIALEGEAFVTVTHDERHPFTIRTHAAVVTDVGTAFDVSAYPGDSRVRVAVAEGRVRVADVGRGRGSSRDGVPAQAGDVVTVQPNGIAIVHDADIGALTDWTTGELRLTDVPVSDALAALSRWYNLDLQLGDPTLGAAHLTGRFRHEPLPQVLSALEALLHARIVQQGGTVTLYPRPSHP